MLVARRAGEAEVVPVPFTFRPIRSSNQINSILAIGGPLVSPFSPPPLLSTLLGGEDQDSSEREHDRGSKCFTCCRKCDLVTIII